MSETNAPEPTMEEILASIRRIISEDDAPAPAAEATTATPADPPKMAEAAAPEPAMPEPAKPEPAKVEARPEPAAPAHEEVLELTDKVEAEPEPIPAALGDIDFADEAPIAAAPAPEPRPATPPLAKPPKRAEAPTPPPSRDEPLVGDGAAGRAADHFGALASSIAMPTAGRTLEDVVRELLRPMLKDWLDQHLATIVEARVQDEVERISRRRTY